MKKSASNSGWAVIVLFFAATMLFSLQGCRKNIKEGAGEVKQQAASDTVVTDSLQGRLIIAKLAVKPERVKEFMAAAKEMIQSSNAEPGCELYQLLQDPYDPGRFIFLERYVNQAAVDTHFASSYFKAFGPTIKDLLISPAEVNIFSAAEVGKK